MFCIKLISHNEITNNELNEVIKIKSSQWKYSYEEHLYWIKKNLHESDIHVLLYLKKKAVAYVNLIDINLVLNGENKKGYGIGNVCAIEKGKGYGLEIMKEVNKIILNSNLIGVLFCKELLLNFYKQTGWKQLESKYFKISRDDIKVMVLNVPDTKNLLIEYDGIIF